jgi:type VI secretion system secreted protein Hcp
MAYDCFLKVEGVKGDSTDAVHKEWMEVMSYSHGVSQAPGGTLSAQGALTGARADHQDFSIVKRLDSASPTLFLLLCSGKGIKEVILELCRATGDKTTFMKYTFKNCIVSGLRPGGSGSSEDPLPMEEVSFRYSEIHLEYTPTTTAGQKGAAVKAAWSTMENKAL